MMWSVFPAYHQQSWLQPVLGRNAWLQCIHSHGAGEAWHELDNCAGVPLQSRAVCGHALLRSALRSGG
jgi:hypothetical protein